MYDSILLTISTIVEILILVVMLREVPEVAAGVKRIQENASGTVYGFSDDLAVGDRVHVRMPHPGMPRESWPFGSEVYVIREVDKLHNRALASPVLPSITGPTPTVSGPVSGPLSPFRKLAIPG
jgi:hypothetical protein